MARLHPELEPALKMLPAAMPLHLFTRHSVRELSPNGFADYRLPLTPEGVVIARDWGASLGHPLQSFHSSPVGRCVNTAQAMMEGAISSGLLEAPGDIEHTMQLVEPGCYVQDINAVGPMFLKMGALKFMNHHLQQEMEGILSPREGRKRLLEYFQARNPSAGKVALHVTHDTIVIAFVASLLGLSGIGEKDWPWMMEGLWLWYDERDLHWIWRGQPGRKPLKEIELMI